MCVFRANKRFHLLGVALHKQTEMCGVSGLNLDLENPRFWLEMDDFTRAGLEWGLHTVGWQ